jgi:hypothetical protein
MGLGPARGRSSVWFGLRHGTISGPTPVPTNQADELVPLPRERGRQLQRRRARGGRERRGARSAGELIGGTCEVGWQASSASPARSGMRCELVAGEEWSAQAGGRPVATSERAAKEPRRASRPAAAAGPRQGWSSRQHSPGSASAAEQASRR